MSKIDGQITGLRKAAQVYRNLGKYAIEVVLLDAADTICELRGALQVASVDYRHLADENAKLRELCADVWHLFTEHGAVHPCDLPMVDAVRERMCELGVEVDG